ncbi:MAG: hypothetical protein UU49_C0001G0032 [Candidatus Magasanikbacteria bacterium GW2011_GWC2_41_17]|uniref:Capsule polysaccharide biosynthesis protein n=2 Tax=Candidatus Magasanikiibacteriota TaxID=1752731 RepID=A0A0G0ZL18_9BACT|nr:MAG: hypothetical protein UU49_C0001G0032 [Candidatus Magasanikbacteria bacterium GW2011_GWC2_41_17]KKS13653.1 MAG: hypothetical protein UU69_C0001G0030 [Candidatus Magasanikbacteria bacterium GW2011_GWA2_41_55]
MKICFFLQRRFAYLGHNLAIILKEKYGVSDFCGYVNLRSSFNFLSSQKDIKYSNLLLDEDIQKKYKEETLDLNYLQWLEKEYGTPNLWPYIAVDRIIMSNQLLREYPYDKPPYTHEEMLRLLQVMSKSILSFLEKEKPDAIFFSVIGSIGTNLLFHMAEKLGVRCYRIANCLKDLTTITYGPNLSLINPMEPSVLTDAQQQQLLIKSKTFLEQYRSKPVSYYIKSDPQYQQTNQTRQLQILLPKNLLNFVKWIFRYFYNYLTDESRFDYTYIKPWYYLIDGLKRKIRNIVGLNDLYDEPDWNEDFAFFPLQFEPESGLLHVAYFKTNQLETVKQVARALPVGYKLYVKEHPTMVMYRPRSFYKELKKNPNVKLINPTTKGFDVISQAKLITTITGSCGWEATLLKKPVITFGQAFYNQLSFIKKCRAFEDLPQMVKEQLENFNYDENELLEYLIKIFESSAPVDLISVWDDASDSQRQKRALEPLADLIAKKLGIKA